MVVSVFGGGNGVFHDKACVCAAFESHLLPYYIFKHNVIQILSGTCFVCRSDGFSFMTAVFLKCSSVEKLILLAS